MIASLEGKTLQPDAISPIAALCPVQLTWTDHGIRMTLASKRLVAIDPLNGTPMDMEPRHIGEWGPIITKSEWFNESQKLAELHLAEVTPVKMASPTGTRKLMEWVPSVLGCQVLDGITDDKTISKSNRAKSRTSKARTPKKSQKTVHVAPTADVDAAYIEAKAVKKDTIKFDLLLTCIEKGKHFGETMHAELLIGWNVNGCESVTGLYQLARTAADTKKSADDPKWAKDMFIMRSAMRVSRSAEKRMPEPITWADANAALNSRSRFMAGHYGITDIRAEALKKAEIDGFLALVQGEHGPGSKWVRTDKPLPEPKTKNDE